MQTRFKENGEGSRKSDVFTENISINITVALKSTSI